MTSEQCGEQVDEKVGTARGTSLSAQESDKQVDHLAVGKLLLTKVAVSERLKQIERAVNERLGVA